VAPGGSLPRLWSLLPGDTWRPGGLELTERALELGAFPAGARLLDVGCGRGVTVRHLRRRYGMEAWGLDLSPEPLTDGSTGFGIRGDAEDLPLAPQVLDGLFCECVLSLLPSPGKALREFQRVLRSGATLVITDLYRRGSGGEGPPDFPAGKSCLGGALGRLEWLAQVEAAGFEPLGWEDHSNLLAEAAARLVWELGSRKALVEKLLPGHCVKEGGISLSKIRPGYFLLMARKKAEKELWTI
jgi:arsenite methyltransferase